MSFYGDLSSIDLGDLLQNLVSNSRTGTLTVKVDGEEHHVFLKDGHISMLAGGGRPILAQMLVSSGYLTKKQLSAIRSKRRGSRKSLGEIMAKVGAMSEEELRTAAGVMLAEDMCNLLTIGTGEFRFGEGNPPSRVFDPEERRLNLRVAVSPLLLEAARRSDHWAMIRKVIPSDSVHFVAVDPAHPVDEYEDPALAAALLRCLDGTCSVREVASRHPQRRFQVYGVLSRFVREHLVRVAESDDLLHSAAHMALDDPRQARAIISRGLKTEPRNLELLHQEVQLAEKVGDNEGAASALKVIAHLKLEAEEKEKARAMLEQARELAPQDTTIWERCFALSVEEERHEDAVREGLELVRLYRAPGLHGKAREVLDRLVDMKPDSMELRLELARTQVDTGASKEAVRSLARHGKLLVSRESYAQARFCYEAILEIEPSNEGARRCTELIDSQSFKRRREGRRRVVRRLTMATVSLLLGILFIFELTARLDLAEATSGISRDRLIEKRRYNEAIERYRQINLRHPLSPTRFLDVRRRIEDLEEKLEARRSSRGWIRSSSQSTQRTS
ncbi:MAG: DUF4388 domain-containing protein [Planctomycetota bacterium]